MAFCPKCGAEVPPDSQFCPKCGRPLSEPAQANPFEGMDRHEMRHAYRSMRREARWSGWASPEWALFNAVFAGLFIVLLGGLLYLAASGTLPSLVTWANFWAYLLLGLGIMLLIRGFLGMLARRYFEYGNIIGGMVLVVIGAAGITISLGGWQQYFWTGIIVLIGIIVILAGVLSYLFQRTWKP